MGEDGSARTKQRSLQQAASVIFAIVAVVPLLILAGTLNVLGAIRSPQAQFALALALGISLLGFWMFRSLLGRMTEVVQTLTVAVEQAGRARRPSVAGSATQGAAPTLQTVAAVATARARTPTIVDASPSPADVATVQAKPAVAPSGRAVDPARPARPVAGLGSIRELTEVVKTVDALWYREATVHLGRRVQISVANSREPLVGTLGEATPDGLILEQADGPLPIAYGRVTSIDRLS
jgi:hypothetical protein